MARVTTQHKTAVGYKAYTPSGGSPVIQTIASLGWDETLTRSDIVRTVASDGWRPPLPYFASSGVRIEPMIASLHGVKPPYMLLGVSYPASDFSITGLIADSYVTRVTANARKNLLSYSDEAKLNIRLLNQIGSAKWSLGEALAEGKESLSMITKSARTLQSALMHASKKNWSGVARSLDVKPKKLGKAAKSISGGWLSYAFGWTPVVQDMASAALQLGGAFDRDSSLIAASGTVTDSLVVEKLIGNGSYSIESGMVSFKVKDTITYNDDMRISLSYTMNHRSLNELSRLGLIGLSTPWAVLPYSYLVDWILPIGDALGAIDAVVGLTFKGGSLTRFTRCTTQRRAQDITVTGKGYTVSGTLEWLPVQDFVMNRSVYSSTPITVPLYVKNPLDPFKAITSIALIGQTIKPH